MNEINERIKMLRVACDKTQEEWGNILGISRSGVAAIESNNRAVTEKHIKMLENWTNKPINTNWLRTGEGEMFRELSIEEEIAAFVGSVLKEQDDTFKKRFITMLAKLDEDAWICLEQIARSMEKIKNDQA